MENEEEVPTLELGRIGYEAYRAHAGGVSLAHGGTLPLWSELEQKFVNAWDAAGGAIGLELVQEMSRISAKTGGKVKMLLHGDFSAVVEAEDPEPNQAESAPAPQKPSIGRIVIYHHAPCNECVSEAHDCPAIVTMTHSDGTLSMYVFSPLCDDAHHAFVAFGTEDGQWSWPERV